MHGEIEMIYLELYLRKVEKEINERFKSVHAYIDNSGMYPELVIKGKEQMIDERAERLKKAIREENFEEIWKIRGEERIK